MTLMQQGRLNAVQDRPLVECEDFAPELVAQMQGTCPVTASRSVGLVARLTGQDAKAAHRAGTGFSPE